MIIIRVGQTEVNDVKIISKAIDTARKQKRNALLMLVSYKGSNRFVAIEIL